MLKDKAADYFERHQNDECHITSDGRVFHTIGTATSFANLLPNNKVSSYKRAKMNVKTEALEDEGKEVDGTTLSTGETEDSGDEGKEVKGPTLSPEKVQALDALENFDATIAQYPEIKALAKDLGLEPVSQKQPDLIAAIEAFKATLTANTQE